MRRSMDAFGYALQEYAEGNREPFYLVDKAGNAYEHPLSKYFRPQKEFTRIERKMISLSRGEILDVGCGTGTYLPSLSKWGNALGIDISPTVVRIARSRGNENCKVADIRKFSPRKRFDAIMLFENNLGMAGTVIGTKRLLKKLSSLLSHNGQILTNARQAKDDHFIAELAPLYLGRKGRAFKWITFSEGALQRICDDAGLDMDVVDRDGEEYLARIRKRAG